MKIICKFSYIIAIVFLFSCNDTELITKNERKWLKTHPDLVVGLSPNAPPYQFVNEKNEISGIFIDFLTIIESRLDYKFIKIYQSDFSKLLTDIKNGSVDVLLEVQETDERKEFLNFTQSLVSHNQVIVVKQSENNIENVIDLKTKNIAVVNKYAIQEYLTKNYPDYKLLPLLNDVACLRAVSTGQADAFVCQQAVATYYIEKEGISNLKIAGEVNYLNNLSIASRKSLDTLNIILSKAVNSIDKNEKLKVYNKWLSYTIKPFYHETKFLILVSFAFLLVIFIVALFNIILQKRVKQKTNELRIAKEKAEKNEQNNQLLFEILPIGLALTKMTGELVSVNKAFTEIIGYSEAETLKLSYWNLTPQKYAEQEQQQLNSLNTTGFYGPYEKEYKHKSGELIPVRLNGRTVIINEEKFIWSSIDNIREKKKNELDLIKAREKAEESDRLKSAFLANMSHEIRTPMNGILGFSELLKEPGLSSETQLEYISIIENGGKRLLNIISEIIDISKIESGQMEVRTQETNICKLVEETFYIFKQEAEKKKLFLSIKTNLDDKQVIINTDREKLYSILTNLVKNAIKYTDVGSIEFGYIKKADVLEFYVKDTGIGIQEERQAAIFERFIQADIIDIQARQGAGLGLSIAKALVEILGGKIWVESEPEKGSTFYFNLPYNVLEMTGIDSKKNNIPIVPEYPANRLKVLIAEDDKTSEMLISITVGTIGREILKARTGKEAVEICQNNPDIDLILMDIQMPDLNGYDATRQIRQFNKNVIIIAQTAFGLTGDREKSIAAGCNDYTSKPIKKDNLLALIQKHFEK